jgi:hypothetical protein
VGLIFGLDILEGTKSLTLTVIRTPEIPVSSLPTTSTMLPQIGKYEMSHSRERERERERETLSFIYEMFCIQPCCQLASLQGVTDTTLNDFTVVLGLRGFVAVGGARKGHILRSQLTKEHTERHN